MDVRMNDGRTDERGMEIPMNVRMNVGTEGKTDG